jgi:hypothetical protein
VAGANIAGVKLRGQMLAESVLVDSFAEFVMQTETRVHYQLDRLG